jgi:myo-inositol-1(or 4)-monophosphatase
MLPKTEITARLAQIDTLIAVARAISVPLFADPKGLENKGENGLFDPVTEADIEGERALRTAILSAFPDDSIEGEELPDHMGTNDFSWTLDPIDGTRAFVAGVPVWSTLIAVSYQGEAVLGVIDLPALDQTYIGQTYGEVSESWLHKPTGRTRLNCASCAEIRDGILGCTAPFGMFGPGELAAFKMIGSGTRFMRLGLDALGYGLLAEGRMDIIIEGGMKACDVRALIPIVHGAGGRLTNWEGGSAADGGRVVAVGDAGLLPELYTYLGRALDS